MPCFRCFVHNPPPNCLSKYRQRRTAFSQQLPLYGLKSLTQENRMSQNRDFRTSVGTPHFSTFPRCGVTNCSAAIKGIVSHIPEHYRHVVAAMLQCVTLNLTTWVKCKSLMLLERFFKILSRSLGAMSIIILLLILEMLFGPIVCYSALSF
jgi:hypothetical protein